MTFSSWKKKKKEEDRTAKKLILFQHFLEQKQKLQLKYILQRFHLFSIPSLNHVPLPNFRINKLEEKKRAGGGMIITKIFFSTYCVPNTEPYITLFKPHNNHMR